MSGPAGSPITAGINRRRDAADGQVTDAPMPLGTDHQKVGRDRRQRPGAHGGGAFSRPLVTAITTAMHNEVSRPTAGSASTVMERR